MRLKLKKLLLAAFSVVLLSAPIASIISSDHVTAAETTNSENNTAFQTFVVPNYQNQVPYTDDSIRTQKNVVTSVVKRAAKYILKHPKKTVEFLEEYAHLPRKQANQILRHFGPLKKQLTYVIKADDAIYQTLYDAVYRGLRGAGVSRSVATNVAEAVKSIISILGVF